MTGALDQIYTCYIDAKAPAVWSALTDPARTPAWFHGLAVHSDWRAGSTIHWTRPGDDRAVVLGEILEVETGADVLHTFRLTAHDDPETRVRIRLTDDDGVTRLVLTHVGFAAQNDTWHHASAGWPRALSALKTRLETGRTLGARSAG